MKVTVESDQFQVSQVLITGMFPFPVDVEMLLMKLDKSIYMTESFPSLRYKHPDKDYQFTISISANGAFMLVGMRSVEQARQGLNQIIAKLESCFIK